MADNITPLQCDNCKNYVGKCPYCHRARPEPDNITPLIPMTQRQLSLMSPEEQRDYWIAVARKWHRNAEAAKDRDYAADYERARHVDDWVGA